MKLAGRETWALQKRISAESALAETRRKGNYEAFTNQMWRDLKMRTPGVYIIRMGTTEAIKVGFSECVEDRLDTLSTSSPWELVVEAKFICPRPVEKALHRLFAANKMRREWFSSAGTVGLAIEFIKRPEFQALLDQYLTLQGVNLIPEVVRVKTSEAPGYFEYPRRLCEFRGKIDLAPFFATHGMTF